MGMIATAKLGPLQRYEFESSGAHYDDTRGLSGGKQMITGFRRSVRTLRVMKLGGAGLLDERSADERW